MLTNKKSISSRPTFSLWPLENTQALNAYYGVNMGPHGPGCAKWESEHLVRWAPPYPMFYAGAPLQALRVHRLCLETFDAAFKDALAQLGLDYIKAHHLDQTGGAYSPRLQRGGTCLSVHSWACAVDIAPAYNPFPRHWQDGAGMMDAKFAAILQSHGFTWRGRPGDNDPMHFQLANRG